MYCVVSEIYVGGCFLADCLYCNSQQIISKNLFPYNHAQWASETQSLRMLPQTKLNKCKIQFFKQRILFQTNINNKKVKNSLQKNGWFKIWLVTQYIRWLNKLNEFYDIFWPQNHWPGEGEGWNYPLLFLDKKLLLIWNLTWKKRNLLILLSILPAFSAGNLAFNLLLLDCIL